MVLRRTIAAAFDSGLALAGLSDEQRAQFEEGKLVFADSEDFDEGLGPVFNGRSCGECHL